MRPKTIVMVVATVGALLATGGVALAATVSCAGGGAECHGTMQDDAITGTARGDVILARAGNDLVRGDGGDDSLRGGEGDDTLRGGEGDDVVDALDGEAGNDTVGCGPGRDVARVDSRGEADASSCEEVVVPVVATGVLERPELTPYMYGSHAITDEASGARYALESSTVDLDAHVGRRVTVRGTVVPGTEDGQVEFGPPLVDVTRVDETPTPHG